MEPTGQTSNPLAPRRAVWSVLLVVCSLWIGLVAGMAVGGRFFVPAGSGLAGPAIALGYGLGGALAGAALAGFLAWKLPAPTVRFAALIGLLLVVLSILLIGYRVVEKQRPRGRNGEAYQRPAVMSPVTTNSKFTPWNLCGRRLLTSAFLT